VRSTLGIVAIFLALAVTGTQAATILDDVDPQSYRDEAALYPMVGKVTGSGFNGSGVLISNRWVITAGHVADFKTGGTYMIGGSSYTIQSYVTHPSHAAFSTTYDVGLLYLSTPVSGVETATMLRFDLPESVVGHEATWVGNGVTGTGLNDTRGANELRGFTNIIDGVTPRSSLPIPSFFSDFDNPTGTSNSLGSDSSPTRLEGNVTAGDSGGGVFVTVGGNKFLVGISSYTSGFSPGLNSKYGSLSGAANLHYFHSWIYQTTGIAAVPEVSTGWFCMVAALFGFVRRR
jgi:hypothetical protein